jgi:hypothetical protein
LKPSRFSPWFCGIHRFDKICLFHPFLSPSYRVFTRFNRHSCWSVSSCFITFLVQSQFSWFNPVNCWYSSLPFLHKTNHANPIITPIAGLNAHLCWLNPKTHRTTILSYWGSMINVLKFKFRLF